MKKRLLAFLLALSIAVSMLAAPVSAAGNNTAVQFAITLGAMDADQSGALNAAVTRGAFAKMLTSYSTFRESVSSQGAVGTLYTDLPGTSAWAPYVRIAVQQHNELLPDCVAPEHIVLPEHPIRVDVRRQDQAVHDAAAVYEYAARIVCLKGIRVIPEKVVIRNAADEDGTRLRGAILLQSDRLHRPAFRLGDRRVPVRNQYYAGNKYNYNYNNCYYNCNRMFSVCFHTVILFEYKPCLTNL